MTSSNDIPTVELSHLDDLWFQVAGTRCNLTCHHCFISCSPKNDRFGYLTFAEVKQRLEESVVCGVKEYYFTGGEPFLNREMVPILVETLRYGPATVLTNGTVFKNEWLEELSKAEKESLYALEFRVSIDGFSPSTNDPIRGEGTFDRAMHGVIQLVQFGFLPIITATRTWTDDQEPQVLKAFVDMLKKAGYPRPRVKILPTIHLGAEEKRSRRYHETERVTVEMMHQFDSTQLVCEHSRIVTDRGIHVCPILIESENSILGQSLEQSMAGYALRHSACFTCYQYGAICSNPSSTKLVQE